MSAPSPGEYCEITLVAIRDDEERLRALQPAAVEALAQSMKEVGQLVPILVYERRDRKAFPFVLIAGAHRLAAARLLKWEVILCRVIPRPASRDDELLAEIDENLMRADLTADERAIHEVRRREVYARLHPPRKRGRPATIDKLPADGQINEEPSYDEARAKETGEAPKTIRNRVARGKRLLAGEPPPPPRKPPAAEPRRLVCPHCGHSWVPD